MKLRIKPNSAQCCRHTLLLNVSSSTNRNFRISLTNALGNLSDVIQKRLRSNSFDPEHADSTQRFVLCRSRACADFLMRSEDPHSASSFRAGEAGQRRVNDGSSNFFPDKQLHSFQNRRSNAQSHNWPFNSQPSGDKIIKLGWSWLSRL